MRRSKGLDREMSALWWVIPGAAGGAVVVPAVGCGFVCWLGPHIWHWSDPLEAVGLLMIVVLVGIPVGLYLGGLAGWAVRRHRA